jgi:hypothetical protein
MTSARMIPPSPATGPAGRRPMTTHPGARSARCAGSLLLLALACALHGADSDDDLPVSWVDASGDLFAGENGGAAVWRMTAWPGTATVVASVTTHGLWASDDAGAHWRRLGQPGQRPPDAGQAVQFLLDPKDARTLWCSGMYGFGCWRSSDGGASFAKLGDQAHLDGLGVDFSDPARTTILIGLHERDRSLHLSADGGASFHLIGDHLPEGTGFSTLPIVLDASTFITNTSGWGDKKWGIWRSQDAGQSWAKVADAGPADHPLIARSGAIFYPLLWEMDHIVSRDHGLTWQKLRAPVRGLLIELPDGTLVGLGGDGRAKLFASSDDGATWKPFGDEVPFKPVGLIYDPAHQAFIAYRSEKGPGPLLVARWELHQEPAAAIMAGSGGVRTAWDGKGHAGGNGWGGVSAQAAVTKAGGQALAFAVANAAESQAGWNWTNWSTSGMTDTSSCTHLQFWCKVQGEQKPAAIAVQLCCGPSKNTSAEVALLPIEPQLLDGGWHRLRIPLASLLAGATGFDARSVFELRLKTRSPQAITASVVVDTIRFVTLAAGAAAVPR